MSEILLEDTVYVIMALQKMIVLVSFSVQHPTVILRVIGSSSDVVPVQKCRPIQFQRHVTAFVSTYRKLFTSLHGLHEQSSDKQWQAYLAVYNVKFR